MRDFVVSWYLRWVCRVFASVDGPNPNPDTLADFAAHMRFVSMTKPRYSRRDAHQTDMLSLEQTPASAASSDDFRTSPLSRSGSAALTSSQAIRDAAEATRAMLARVNLIPADYSRELALR